MGWRPLQEDQHTALAPRAGTSPGCLLVPADQRHVGSFRAALLRNVANADIVVTMTLGGATLARGTEALLFHRVARFLRCAQTSLIAPPIREG